MSKRKRLPEPFMNAAGQRIEVDDWVVLTSYGTEIARYVGIERDNHGMLYPVFLDCRRPNETAAEARKRSDGRQGLHPNQAWREVRLLDAWLCRALKCKLPRGLPPLPWYPGVADIFVSPEQRTAVESALPRATPTIRPC
jgi:hypothetical protein